MISLTDIQCHEIIQTLINLCFRLPQKLLILSPSLNLTPYQAFLTSFWLKNLGCHLSTQKRESKLMSLVLNGLHDLAAKTAPGTSQADGPCTPWACYLHSISMAASHYRLCLEDRVSSHLPKHHLPTSSGQLVPSFLKLAPTIPVIFPSWDLIITQNLGLYSQFYIWYFCHVILLLLDLYFAS